ncbi:hypothetical protein J1N35_043152 [Gossypium stocksii]|uniref:Uncharacterized protein n=1 Tax=Gossypium stocksii TaxID=47602 RepID=A0A9D3U6V8_9ROSI|nr:hypothetical protein J1N35_043152 [Gossypium stocksii]
MHESDNVMQQFGFRYDFLPTRKAIIAVKLACDPEYKPWFRHHGKPYPLAEEVRGRQRYTRRPRRALRHPSTTSCTTFVYFYIDARFYFWTTTCIFGILHTDAIDISNDDDSDNDI